MPALSRSLIVFLFAAAAASADLTTWTLHDVTLSDGATVTGSFTFDPDPGSQRDIVSAIDITAGAGVATTDTNPFGPVGFDAFTWTIGRQFIGAAFNPASVPVTQPGGPSLEALGVDFNSGFVYQLLLTFDGPLTDAGGDVTVVPGSIGSADGPNAPVNSRENCCDGELTSTITGGYVSGAPATVTPEPRTWLLVAMLSTAICFRKYSRLGQAR